MRTTTAFTAQPRRELVCGLDFPFTFRVIHPGRCLPSSLYTFLNDWVQAWLGITTARGFPEFDRCSHGNFFPCSPDGDHHPIPRHFADRGWHLCKFDSPRE